MRYAFLGPEGTFCEAALRRFDPGAEPVPAVDVTSALEAVRTGAVDGAVVPIENSVEGGVNATIDSLSRGRELAIVGEVVIPVQFVLAVRPGTTLENIRSVGTHSHAWAQCRGWLHTHLPSAIHVTTASTAAGAAELASGAASFDAALCSTLSAETYQLDALASGVADNPDAVTRFVAVSLPGNVPAPTGSDKTTLMVQLGHNEAGGLLEMLEQFSVRGVNLSRIESRPIGDSLGRYAFSIDAEGHVREERMQAVLIGLHRISPEVRFIGSYPAAERRIIKRRPGTSDADFIEARAWVSSLLCEGMEPEELEAPKQQVRLAGDAKERILQAARLEFSRHGYSGASIRQVAASADVDAGLVGYHFGSKAKLFDAAIEGVFDSLTNLIDFLLSLAHAYKDNPDPAPAVARELIEQYRAAGEDLFSRDLVILLRTILTPVSGADPIRDAVIERTRATLEKTVESASSVFRAQAVMGMLVGVLFVRFIAQIRPLYDSSTEDLLAIIAHRFVDIARTDPSGLGEMAQVPRKPIDDLSLIEDTRERILGVARERFAQWGYAGTSLREIASSCRCDISLIHYYFGSKLGLYEASIDVRFGTAGAVRRHTEDGVISLHGVIGDLLCMWSDQKEGAAVRSLLTTAADPETDAVGEMVRKRLQRLFDEVIEPRDPRGGDFPLYLLGAEAIGDVILRDFIGTEPFALLSDSAMTEMFTRSVVRTDWLTRQVGGVA